VIDLTIMDHLHLTHENHNNTKQRPSCGQFSHVIKKFFIARASSPLTWIGVETRSEARVLRLAESFDRKIQHVVLQYTASRRFNGAALVPTVNLPRCCQ
jgi:hypothetical protein